MKGPPQILMISVGSIGDTVASSTPKPSASRLKSEARANTSGCSSSESSTRTMALLRGEAEQASPATSARASSGVREVNAFSAMVWTSESHDPSCEGGAVKSGESSATLHRLPNPQGRATRAVSSWQLSGRSDGCFNSHAAPLRLITYECIPLVCEPFTILKCWTRGGACRLICRACS